MSKIKGLSWNTIELIILECTSLVYPSRHCIYIHLNKYIPYSTYHMYVSSLYQQGFEGKGKDKFHVFFYLCF